MYKIEVHPNFIFEHMFTYVDIVHDEKLGIDFTHSNTTILHIPQGGLFYDSDRPLFVSTDIVVGNYSFKKIQKQLVDNFQSLEEQNEHLIKRVKGLEEKNLQFIDRVKSLEEKNLLLMDSYQQLMTKFQSLHSLLEKRWI